MVSTMKSVEQVTIPEGYKQTEVGVIPNEWMIKALERLGNGNTPPIKAGPFGSSLTKDTYVSSGYKVYGQEQVIKGDHRYGDYYITALKYRDLYSCAVKTGDILLSLVGTTGKLLIISPDAQEGVINPRLLRFSFDKKIVNSEFFKFLFESEFIQNLLSRSAQGGTMAVLNAGMLRTLEIPLPSIKEQTAIANALSDVDNLIASLETLIAKKSAIKTAAMQQLLTGKKRLPGFEGKSVKESEKQSSELDNTSETAQAAQTKQTSTLNSDLYKEPSEGLDSKSNQHFEVGNGNNKQTDLRPGYKQTELGEIPEDWEIKLLGDLCSYQNGTALEKYFNHHDGYKVISIGNYSESGRFVETNNFIDREHNSVVQKFVLNKNDLSMILNDKTAVGTIIGRVLLVEADDSYVINQRSMRLTPNSLVLPKYLHLLINSNFIHKNIVGLAKPGTQIYVNTDDVTGLPLILPKDIKEQTAIANVLSDMDTELDALQQRLSKTQKIKQGMMQELLTGKTRLV